MTRETFTVSVRDGSSYPVTFGSLDFLAGSLDAAGVRPGRAFVVTDRNVHEAHGAHLEALLAWAGFDVCVEAIAPGEGSKSPRHLDALYERALEWGIDRQTPVIAFGGGVVGDLAGFAAATLLRGVPLVQIPTTLVAQVDSALGGKTGINHRLGKNLIGAFHAPCLVYVDPALLQTLPQREWTGGLAEVVKHAAIADASFFAWLEDHWKAIEMREAGAVATTIRQAGRIKIRIVSADEREHGDRMLLNFGHTFGHAIERVAGYGLYTHGEAVALGMRAAVLLSAQYHPDLPTERLLDLIGRIPLPDFRVPLDPASLVAAMRHDKKALAGALRFVLLRNIGEAYVRSGVPEGAVVEALRAALGPRVGA